MQGDVFEQQISKSCFQKLLDHYQNHGLSVRIHGNSRRVPHNTLTQAIVEDVKNELWKQFHPNLVVGKPMSDLCVTCQQNTSKLLRAANLPEEEKSECVQAQQAHSNLIQVERELYRNFCDKATSNFKAIEAQIDMDEYHEACSLRKTMHYSFDFAQQVHIPSNPMQPGPIYFKTPRKFSIFGVMCEAIPH